MGLCASKVQDGPDTEAEGDDNEEVPIKKFGGKGKRRKRDSIAYNKDTIEKRHANPDAKSSAPPSMVEIIE